MRRTGIITYEKDPMYEAKRYLFWNSGIGVNDGDSGESLRREAEAHEAELDARNPLMCRFTKRVMKAIRNAQEKALAENDMKAFNKLRKLHNKYHLRLVHFQHSEEENFYLFSPECFYTRGEEQRALIARCSGKDRD